MKTQVTIPKQTKPNSGIIRSLARNKITYFARYIEDGAIKRKILEADSLEEARQARDEFYQSLRESPDVQVAQGQAKYVYEVRMFLVRVGKTYVGSYPTEEKAILERDKFMKREKLSPKSK